MEYVTVGKIIGPWGNKGKLKVQPETDFPQRFSPDTLLYVNQKEVIVESAEWHMEKLFIKLRGIDSIQDAELLRSNFLQVPKSQIFPLHEGYYYHFQILGLEVRTTSNKSLGNITGIMATKSNDNYIIRGDYGEILIPAIEDIITSIDLDKGLMIIEPIKGLLTLNS